MNGIDFLSPQESECLAALVHVAQKLHQITMPDPQYPFDWQEAASHIHALQQMVMSQAAARAYPARFRLLGESLDNAQRGKL